VAPEAWIGVGADVLLELVGGAGTAGRLNAANIAGTVTAGGRVGVIEQVGTDHGGHLKFLASYVYKAMINGRETTALLAVCSADVVRKK